MSSPLLASEASTFADRPIDEAPPYHCRPAIAPDDAEYYNLLREISVYEGEVVEDTPLLFKLTVAAGCAMALAGSVGISLCLYRITNWLI